MLDLVICFHGLSRDTRNGDQMVYVLSVLVCCGEALSFLSKFDFGSFISKFCVGRKVCIMCTPGMNTITQLLPLYDIIKLISGMNTIIPLLPPYDIIYFEYFDKYINIKHVLNNLSGHCVGISYIIRSPLLLNHVIYGR